MNQLILATLSAACLPSSALPASGSMGIISARVF